MSKDINDFIVKDNGKPFCPIVLKSRTDDVQAYDFRIMEVHVLASGLDEDNIEDEEDLKGL